MPHGEVVEEKILQEKLEHLEIKYLKGTVQRDRRWYKSGINQILYPLPSRLTVPLNKKIVHV